MYKIRLSTVILLLFIGSPALFAQEGIGTNQPDKSAALEIMSSKRGLLIPRFDIPDLENSSPVSNPADALLVFNTGTSGTAKGLYYWDDNQAKWISLKGGGSGGNDDPVDFELQATDPLVVTDLGGDIYEIGLGLPNDENHVLVSQLNADNEIEAVWVNLNDLLSGGDFTVENGLQWEDPDNPTVLKLGGTLTEDTAIDTDGNELVIAGLEEIDPADLPDYKVMVMDADGLLKLIASNELGGGGGIDGEIEADNALHIAEEKIMLGGNLIKETIITTDETNTLAIEGLQEAENENKLIVAEEEGLLRSVTRTVSETLNSSASVGSFTNYSPYVPEINVDVDISGLSSGDIDLELPDAAAAEGQVINIRLSEGNEADNYLNIISGGSMLSYGALPYQGWIIKSNGSKWLIVGRN